MKSVLAFAACAAVAVAAPAPAEYNAYGAESLKAIKRATPTLTDADILNYALTLEYLEATFYKEGLANYSESDFAAAGFDSTFYTNLKLVAGDEQTHASFLSAALTKAGATPVQPCTYDFSSATDPKSFLELASVLEGVGVGAYLGAAAYIMSATYLEAAGSILTVESRHSTYIRAGLGMPAIASPFDVPLTFNEVYTLASPFLASCPSSNPMLPFKAFPALESAPSNGNITSGDKITLLTPGSIVKPAMGGQQIYVAFITVTGPVFAEATAVEGGFTVTVPMGAEGGAPIAGQTFAVLTGCNTTVTDDTVAAGPATFEVSPAVA